MAIDTQAARLLLAAARAGVAFNRSLLLGRQHYIPGNEESRRLLREAGFDPEKYPRLVTSPCSHRFAEPFFEVLGASSIDTLDASGFEGASFVHDLNQPLPPSLASQYDVVYDGGTLEHVFNVPAALRNCMELVRVGGHVFLHTPANNYFGHGFYQFSPELFFRVFSQDNGFELERVIAMEYGPSHRAYTVRDPAAIGSRTPLVNAFPVLLFVQARKQAQVPLFEKPPHQSDYAAVWNNARSERPTPAPENTSPGIRFRRALVERIPRLVRWMEAVALSPLNRRLSFRNRAAFEPFRSNHTNWNRTPNSGGTRGPSA